MAFHHDPGEPWIQQRSGGQWILITERKTGDGGTVAIYSDITDLKQREEELTTKSNALEETNKRFKEVQEQISKYIDPNVTEKIFKGERGDALACLRMALEMQMKMKTLQEKWWNQGIQFPFEIRCGIHTGMANVGNYGSEGFMEYSAIGLNTNLAARLEKACQPGDIYIAYFVGLG